MLYKAEIVSSSPTTGQRARDLSAGTTDDTQLQVHSQERTHDMNGQTNAGTEMKLPLRRADTTGMKRTSYYRDDAASKKGSPHAPRMLPSFLRTRMLRFRLVLHLLLHAAAFRDQGRVRAALHVRSSCRRCTYNTKNRTLQTTTGESANPAAPTAVLHPGQTILWRNIVCADPSETPPKARRKTHNTAATAATMPPPNVGGKRQMTVHRHRTHV